ncbi:uncharacterized protein LOC123425166 [Hordeum vulgare subsp. vulgare]|uniref:uncharacterized protein LOC123425166 n=1 Tax=Hordeum vulgare subsp. vulgare TaxID=112509 RepID=UPI001D1A40F3|nr:uncharacterized protein LOC123425166 [Hordeum vulgare subsp. vulgare]
MPVEVEPASVLVAINPIVFSFLAEEIVSVSGFVDSRSLTLINAYEVMNRPINLLLTLPDHVCPCITGFIHVYPHMLMLLISEQFYIQFHMGTQHMVMSVLKLLGAFTCENHMKLTCQNCPGVLGKKNLPS